MFDGSNLAAWHKFSSFEVFGDYAPMNPAFRLVVALGIDSAALAEALEQRAGQHELLDPDLARVCLRAGLGLTRSQLVDFVYATTEATVAVVRADAVRTRGAAAVVHSQLHARFTARLALLLGREVATCARLFEFPDLRVVRRALTSLAEDLEEATPWRTSSWLGAQLRGRGQPFHPSMIESLEEQMSLLQAHGVDLERLPAWWWRGIAAAVRSDGATAIFDELPSAEAFGQLVADQ